MGGCGSTGFIAWASRRLDCNCPLNSEGLPAPGPGSNVKGLKHRISPPLLDDPYLPDGKRIEKCIFLFDSPFQIIPSLFRRRIAVGHAIAITGQCPKHNNDIDRFLEAGTDSFGFDKQFKQWSESRATEYPILLVRSSEIWSHLSEVLEFLELSPAQKKAFPPKRERNSSFENFSAGQQTRMMEIYGGLDAKINGAESLRRIANG